jgi:hypothetical protein
VLMNGCRTQQRPGWHRWPPHRISWKELRAAGYDSYRIDDSIGHSR